MKKIAKQRFIASMTGALNWPVVKTYSECHSEKDGFGFLKCIRERLVAGPSCQFSYVPGTLGFSEKTLILKETIL